MPKKRVKYSLIDLRAKPRMPVSCQISLDEAREVFPNKVPRRQNWAFRWNVTIDFAEKELVDFLIRKYQTIRLVNKDLKVIDHSEYLETLDYLYLRKLGKAYGLNGKQVRVKKPKLIEAISHRFEEGVLIKDLARGLK